MTRYENNENLKQTLFSYLNVNELSKSTKSIELLKNSKRLILNTPVYKQYSDCYTKLTTSHTFKLPNVSTYPIQHNHDMISLQSVYSQPITQPNKISLKKKQFKQLNLSSDLKILKPENLNKLSCLFMKKINEHTFLKCVDQFNDTNNVMHKYINYKETYFINKNNDRNLNLLKEMLNKYTIDEIISDNSPKKIENTFTINEGNIMVRFKFSSLKLTFYNETNKKIGQIIFPFKLMPFIYGISFQLFKTFLALIIEYDSKTQTFCINETKYKLYYEYFQNNLDLYNNALFIFPQHNKQYVYYYDWIIRHKDKALKYKIKISFPYMSILMLNRVIKMKSSVRKSLDIPHVAYFIHKDFDDWDFYLLNSFSIYRQFRIIVNNTLSIMNNKVNNTKLIITKENLDYSISKSKISEISCEFFVTFTNNDNASYFYKLTAPKIKINYNLNKEHIDCCKVFQLNMKQAIQLNKFSYHYSIKELLKKCTNVKKMPPKEGQYNIMDITLNINDMIFNFDESLLEFFNYISARDKGIKGNLNVVFLEPVIEWICEEEKCFIKKLHVMDKDKYRMMFDLPMEKFSVFISRLNKIIEKSVFKISKLDEEVSLDELKMEKAKFMQKVTLKNKKIKKDVE